MSYGFVSFWVIQRQWRPHASLESSWHGATAAFTIWAFLLIFFVILAGVWVLGDAVPIRVHPAYGPEAVRAAWPVLVILGCGVLTDHVFCRLRSADLGQHPAARHAPLVFAVMLGSELLSLLGVTAMYVLFANKL